MPEMKPYDDLEKLVSPGGIQVMAEALEKMQESMRVFAEEVSQAAEDETNKNHELVMKAIADIKMREGGETTPEHDAVLNHAVYQEQIRLVSIAVGMTEETVLAMVENVLFHEDVQKMKEVSEKLEEINRFRGKYGNSKTNEERKLPKKLRNGWK